MRALLDTHFVLWITGGSSRLEDYGWIDDYRPWGVSPVSFLEIRYLGEVGRLDVADSYPDRVSKDPRFEIDDIGSLVLIRHALPLSWTRDPFDRLLAGHSAARRVPLCTADESIVRNHAYLPDEIR